MNIKGLVLGLGFTAVLGLISCGGNDKPDSNGTPGRITIGAITGFGSVFVAGVEHHTDQASITIDGLASSESDLAVGMAVAVRSSTDGTVSSITTADQVEGIVISNDIATSNSLNIMGVTVQVDSNTVFESDVATITSTAMISNGNIVEVYGFPGETNTVFATRLEVKAADLPTYLLLHPEGVEVTAKISELDAVNRTFAIGTLPVNYADALLDTHSPLSNGMLVEVKSTLGLINDVLIASKVDSANDAINPQDSDEFETQAVISRDFDGSSFSLAGVNVVINDQTELGNNTTTADLLTGTLVKVEGVFNAEGDVLARKVELENEVTAEFEGFVQSVSTTDVNTGTVTMDTGRSFRVNNWTRMRDERKTDPVAAFNLSHLAAGDYIKVGVFEDPASGTEVAVKLRREDAP